MDRLQLQRLGLLITTAVSSVACGRSATPASSTDAAMDFDGPVPVGVVTGAADMHCIGAGGNVKASVIGTCAADPGLSDASAGDAAAAEGGSTTSSAAMAFGQTMYNAQGDDDDCKYHVSWISSPIQENANVMFTITVSRLIDGQPAKGADVGLTAFLTDSHPTPSPAINNGELPGGSYNVGPVIFDAPGTWTVRFLLYPTCSDTPGDSPQGHAAFYVSVP